MIREHYPKMARGIGRRGRSSSGSTICSARVFEFTELLVDKLGVTDVGASYPHTVTLHRPATRSRSLRSRRSSRGGCCRRSAASTLVDLPGAGTSAAASAAPSR